MNRAGISRGTYLAALVSLILVVITIARDYPFSDGSSNLHAHQAQAFLQGRVDLSGNFTDTAVFGKRYYSPFPPFPAVLLTPLVALFGNVAINVLVVSTALTLLNLFVFNRVLVRFDIDPDTRIWLAMAFFLGTAYWLAFLGSDGVWFFSQIVAVTFILLAIREALGRGRGLLAGLFLGCAFLSRQLAILAAVFIFVALFETYKSDSSTRRILNLAGFMSMILLSIGIYLGFNYLRFGNPFDAGYAYIDHVGPLRIRFDQYGLFNPAYIFFNAAYMFFQGPHLVFADDSLLPQGMDPFGTSLLFASPFVLFAFLARWKKSLLFGAWASIVLILVAQLLYYNNGWVQSNAQRFSLDFMPILILLVALSLASINRRLFRYSVVYAVLLNTFVYLLLPLINIK